MNVIRVVIERDIKELLRDKRTLSNMLTIVIFMPIMIAAMIGFISTKATSDRDKRYDIHVVKQNAFPDFETQAKISEHNVVYVDEIDVEKIKSQEIGVFIKFGEDFQEDLRAGEPAEVFVYYNHKNDKSRNAYRAARDILNNIDGQIRAGRVIAKGVNLQYLQPFDIKLRKISKDKRAEEAYLMFLNMLFIYCVLLTVPLITPDIITGERERRFLEPLIQLPFDRSQLLYARALLFILIGVVATVIGVGLFTGIMSLPFYQTLTGFFVVIDFGLVLSAYLIYLPITVIVAWASIYIGSLSKSIKEAQLLIGIMSAVVFIGVFSAAFFPSSLKDQLVNLPFLGQAILFDRLKSNVNISAMDVLIPTVLTLLIAAVFAVLCIRLYRQESLIVKNLK